MTAPAALDAVRCRLALGGSEEVSPPELLRLCREAGGERSAGELYAELVLSGELVPVDTPFGPRLGVTGSVVTGADRALRRSAPPPASAPIPAETFAVPTLLHDLLTLGGFVRREQPRVTGRGLLAAPALRRLEGLALTADAVAPSLDRRSPPGTHVWQFLFHFLCAQRLVRLDGGRALATHPALSEAIAEQHRAFAALLFTFSAARRPVADSGWLSALERPLPAAWERRRLVAWLAEAGARVPGDAVDRTAALLEGVGFGRVVGTRIVLLPAAASLWPGSATGAPGRGPAPGSAPPTLRLPGGGIAVDLAAGEAALGARVPFDREASPENVGHLLVYGATASHRLGDSGPRLTVRLAALVQGDDDPLLAAVAEAMGPAAVARWPGGMAVEAIAMEEAVERLERLGAKIARRTLWAGPAAPEASAPPPAHAAALPWTLARAREGAWASDGSGAFRPLRTPAALAPGAAQALPSIPARLRAALALGWPVSLAADGAGRSALVAALRWEGGEERVELLWLDGCDGPPTLPVEAIRDVRFAGTATGSPKSAQA